MTKPDDALLPCAHCAEAKRLPTVGDGVTSWIVCRSCGACGPVSRSPSEAIAAWNRRADAGLLAALEQTREMLSLVEQAICDALCPAQWKTGEEPPHCDLHKDILACLAKHEPARDAARKALEPQP